MALSINSAACLLDLDGVIVDGFQVHDGDRRDPHLAQRAQDAVDGLLVLRVQEHAPVGPAAPGARMMSTGGLGAPIVRTFMEPPPGANPGADAVIFHCPERRPMIE